jgi:hypothetical protein
MSISPDDTLMVIPKTLRNKIKSKAAELGISMREYLKRLVEGVK